jgi:hypothetical protein
MRHLTTLVLSGILGSIVLAGDAEACHKKRCACATPVACVAPAPVVYVQPVVCVQKVRCARPAPCARPARCARPAVACAPRQKHCDGSLLAGLCHKRTAITVACASPVSYGTPVPSGQSAPPQASLQN